jgi:hypothetical protein
MSVEELIEILKGYDSKLLIALRYVSDEDGYWPMIYRKLTKDDIQSDPSALMDDHTGNNIPSV